MQKGSEGVNGCLSPSMPLFSVCGAASRACWSFMLVLRMCYQLDYFPWILISLF